MSDVKLIDAEDTLWKVYEALLVLGITGTMATDVVTEIMNRNIAVRDD